MYFISHILLQGQLPQQTGSFKGAYTSGYEASEHRELRQERQNAEVIPAPLIFTSVKHSLLFSALLLS